MTIVNPATTTEPRTDPRGGRRRHKTRMALLGAGQRLFAHRSMESVTIDDIVESADVAKGSFYNHFEDKLGLASAVSNSVQQDCEAEIGRANDGIADAAVRVVRALCVMVLYAAAHPERLQALLSLSERRTIATTPLNAGVSDDVQRGLIEGRFRDITLEAGVVVVIGLTRTTVAHTLAEATPTPTIELTTLIGAAMLRALGVPASEAVNLAQSAATDLMVMEIVR